MESYWRELQRATRHHSSGRRSHPGALAGFVLVVDLLLGPFVQFGPQGFDLPGADCSLQGAVEVAAVQRVQLQLSAQDAEGLQSPFAGGCLDKVLKELAGPSRALILRLTHGLQKCSAQIATNPYSPEGS